MGDLNISKKLPLPLDAVTEAIGFLAKRGGGKTYSAGVVAEEMLDAGAQVVVLDPVSKWWGLTVAGDGKDRGFEIPVFGGPHGDLPLHPGAGRELAQLVVGRKLSAIFDLISFDTDAEHRRFAADFLRELYRLKSQEAAPEPLHVFLEEAEEFAPQNFESGETRMIGAVKKLVKLGRNFGIGCSIITQRSADVNKKILSQIGMLFAFQTTSPHDLKAIKSWVDASGVADFDAKEMARLAVGQARVWHPGWDIDAKVQIRKKRTFDSSATPKMGKKRKRAERPRLSEEEIAELRETLAATLEEAEKDDPKRLRRRINELERELAAARQEQTIAPAVPVDAEDIADLRRIDEMYWGSVAKSAEVARSACDDLFYRLDLFEGPMSNLQGIADRCDGSLDKVPRAPAPPAPPPPRPAAAPRGNGRGALVAGQRRILRALTLKARMSREEVGFAAGVAPNGGTFTTYLGKLKKAGLVADADGGGLTLTADGRREANGAAPPERDEVLDHWRKNAGPRGARAMYEALIAAWPAGLTRDELGARADVAPSGGTFTTYLGKLRRKALVEERDGLLYASEALFVAG